MKKRFHKITSIFLASVMGMSVFPVQMAGAEEVISEQITVEETVSEQIMTENILTEQVETEQVETEQVETEQVETEQIETEQVETEQIEAEQVETEQREEEQILSEEAISDEIMEIASEAGQIIEQQPVEQPAFETESEPDLEVITDDSVEMELIIAEAETEYLLSEDDFLLSELITADDVIGTWEGYYEDISAESEICRHDIQVFIDDCNENGGISGIASIDFGNGGNILFEGLADFVTGGVTFAGTEWMKDMGYAMPGIFIGELDAASLSMAGSIGDDESRHFSLSKMSAVGIPATIEDTADAEEPPDFDIWMAENMCTGFENDGNGLYPMFRSFQPPVYAQLGEYLMEDKALVGISAAWSIFFNSEYRNQFANEQKYIYEVILMQYLKYDSGCKEAKTECINNEMKFSMELYKTISEDLSDKTLDYIDKNMTVEEAISLCNNTKILDGIGTAVSELKDGVDSVKDLINVFSEYMALQQVRDERVYMLKTVRDTCAASDTPDLDFIKAADDPYD